MSNEKIKIARAKIDQAKQQVAQAEGSLATHKTTLAEKYGPTSVEEAEALSTATKAELSLKQSQLAEALATVDKIFAEAGV